MLDVEEGMLGLRDATPASPYRVDPADRSADTITRDLGGGLSYVDLGGLDVIRMTPGSHWQPPFRDPAARLLAVEIVVPAPGPGVAAVETTAPLIEIDTGTAKIPFGAGLEPGWARVVVPVDGVGDAVTIRALADVDLVRVTAFEPLAGVTLPVDHGPVRFAPDDAVPAVMIELVRGRRALGARRSSPSARLLVLPGVRIADRLAGDARAFVPRLILAVVASQVIVAVIGLASSSRSGCSPGVAVAIVAGVLALTGLPIGGPLAARVARPSSRPSAGRRRSRCPGRSPSAGPAGRRRTRSSGITRGSGRSSRPPAGSRPRSPSGARPSAGCPTTSSSTSTARRTSPGSRFLPRADALAAFRVPVTMLGVLLLFAVLRLWVGRPAAFIGAALIAGTTFYLAKFDAYKPEALGIVLGLAALWLVVRGVRSGRRIVGPARRREPRRRACPSMPSRRP